MQVDEIWSGDCLGRKPEAEMLLRFLLSQLEFRERRGLQKTFVLNLDAPWGGGKSFFLDRFGRDLVARGYIVAKVNAWESDHLDDPLLAVFSELKSSLEAAARERNVLDAFRRRIDPIKKGAGIIATKAATGAIKQLVRRAFGEGEGEEVLEALGMEAAGALSEQIIDAFEEKKATIANFKSDLHELVELVSQGSGEVQPVFVLIDELDRCRPDYAVTLLERVKHLFSLDGVVFVLATDAEQLTHTISGAYGANFDSFRYLRRFFGKNYRFRTVSLDAFVSDRFAQLGLDERDFNSVPGMSTCDFLSEAFLFARCQLRDIEQMMESLQTFRAVWPYPKAKIQIPYLLPLVHEKMLSRSDIEAGGSPIRKMPLTLREVYDYGRSQVTVLLSLDRFIAGIEMRGDNIFGSHSWSGNAIDNWIQGVFIEERSGIHNNSYLPGAPPSSVVFEYASQLDVVGQFDKAS